MQLKEGLHIFVKFKDEHIFKQENWKWKRNYYHRFNCINYLFYWQGTELVVNLNIQYTDWGIAYAFIRNNKQFIELNRELDKCPELKNMVLEHEKEHLKNPNFFSTLWIELKSMLNFKLHYLMVKHLSWRIRMQSLIPIWRYNGQININLALLTIYLLLGIIVIL